jgi:uroporphyrinogen-III synthase
MSAVASGAEPGPGPRSAALGGAGIVITRPVRQAAVLAQQVAALGGTPIIFPAIVIAPARDPAPLARALRELDRYDFAVFVSANAVLHALAGAPPWPANVVALAPGAGTAATLQAAGVATVRTPESGTDSEALLALPELADIAGKRVVIFRGNGGRELLGEALRARGAIVDHVECYRREKPQSGAAGLAEAWSEGRVDAVTITSSEGLENLWDMLDAATRTRFARTATFVPHPRIAEKARALSLAHVVVTAPNDAGLLASLVEYFAARKN